MRNLIDKIKYALIWLTRIGDCRGFGVQSPSAYSFIRYVINEHYPYYSYSDLKYSFSNLSWKERKMSELYFRLSNYVQSSNWYVFGNISNSLNSYLKAGCNSTNIYDFDTFLSGVSSSDKVCSKFRSSVVLVKELLTEAQINFILTHLSNDSILVLENIYSSSSFKRQWNKLKYEARTGCSYDLYYCGILFMDTSKIKQHYKVNF